MSALTIEDVLIALEEIDRKNNIQDDDLTIARVKERFPAWSSARCRKHLDRLVQAGLLEPLSLMATGAGRPKPIWRIKQQPQKSGPSKPKKN